MALSYTLAGSAFTDTQHGTAANATAIQSLVNQVVDRQYHKQVLKKSVFNKMGMIGPNPYSEGTTEGSAPGFPVIRKMQLQAESGDVIKMGLLRKLTSDHKTGGVVLNAQLVDNESTYDFYNLKVSIERWREAVYGYGAMNEQRNPYGKSIKGIQEEVLQDWNAEIYDTATLYALWCGWSPHLMRAWGVTKCPITDNPNTLFGNDRSLDTTRTIANVTGTADDDVKAETFSIGRAYMKQNDIDPVMIDGRPYYVALISPMARFFLLKDADFRNSQQHARERSVDNPLFKGADFIYDGVLIMEYDKIRSILGGLNPAGTTVGSSELTEAAYTGIGGGVLYTQLHQTQFLGANAVAVAEGRMGIVDRKEDDYGNVIGTGIDMIFGARRADWSEEDATGVANQSSLCIVNTLIGS